MSPYRFGGTVLVLCMAVIAGASYLLLRPGTPPSPLVRYHCAQQVYGSTQRWFCSDGHAYDHYPDGHWQDAGPLAPSPATPRE